MPASREELYHLARRIRAVLWELRSFHPLDKALRDEITGALSETNELAQAYESGAATVQVLVHVLKRYQGIYRQLADIPRDRLPREFALDITMVMHEVPKAIGD